MEKTKDVIPLDQRKAAAMLLCAIELPANATKAMKLMALAAKVYPDMMASDMPNVAGKEARIAALTTVYKMVRKLILEARET